MKRKTTNVKPSTPKTRRSSHQNTQGSINDQTFDLLMERFDRVDADNNEIKLSVAKHVTDDNTFHTGIAATLAMHKSYWKLMAAVGTAVLAGAVSIAAAFIH